MCIVENSKNDAACELCIGSQLVNDLTANGIEARVRVVEK